ncbi:hypothetical protein CEP54_006121 [Fusarium duplospermum]|uniref:Uncharacterized protein n=1 Tax=Fusarium duplospermum TaxID=1325734 RepID=A0A428Q921_9HYPO|nr:hypothetical protein CEP54_006121 [Fusarium duplospermum]
MRPLRPANRWGIRFIVIAHRLCSIYIKSALDRLSLETTKKKTTHVVSIVGPLDYKAEKVINHILERQNLGEDYPKEQTKVVSTLKEGSAGEMDGWIADDCANVQSQPVMLICNAKSNKKLFVSPLHRFMPPTRKDIYELTLGDI